MGTKMLDKRLEQMGYNRNIPRYNLYTNFHDWTTNPL